MENLGESSDKGERTAYERILAQKVPIGRTGDSFDVASATVFLASNASRYITGQNLAVDGGLTVSASLS